MKDSEALLRSVRPGEVDLAVVGPEVRDPVALAQRLNARDPDVGVLLVTEPAQQQRLVQAVRFSPFVGSDVSCRSSGDVEGLALAAQAASQRAQQRRNHRAMLAVVQADLPPPRTVGPRPSEVLTRLLDLVPVGVALVDAQGRIQAWNRTVAGFTGQSEVEVLGRPFVGLVDEAEQEPLRRHLEVAATGAQVQPLPLRMARPGGERRLEVLAAPVEGTGGGALVVLQDVTDRWRYQDALQREVEERTAELQVLARRHEHLLQAVGEGICGLDDRGRVTFANDAAARLLGRPSVDLVGASLHEVVHRPPPGRDPAPHEDCPLRAALGAGVPRTGEDVFWHRQGAPVQVEYFLAPLPEEAVTGGAVVLFRDIGERRRAEQAQREAAERLAEIQRLREIDAFKTRFINLAAHELNTPLTPLRLQLDLLKVKVPRAPELDASWEMLDRNLERLTQLVRDLLEAARAQGGRLRVQPEPVDLAQVVEEAASAFQESMRRAGLQWEVVVPVPLPALADPQRISQVLFNLLSNAVKFTPRGGRVTLRGRVVGERVRVEVEDTGKGFTEAQGARLFQPFTQVHEDAWSSSPGTGLGLYISRSILELQGGTLGAASPGHGRGATFFFELPLRRQATTATPQRTVHNP